MKANATSSIHVSPERFTQAGRRRTHASPVRLGRYSSLGSRRAIQHLAQLVQTEGLPQDRLRGALQLIPRLRGDRVPGREHDVTLPPAPLEPEVLEQVETRVRLVEVHIHEEGVVSLVRPRELPGGLFKASDASDLVPEPLRKEH